MKQAFFAAIDLLGFNAWFRRKHRGEIKVLLYHNITPDGAHFDNALSPEAFSRQISYLLRHYNIIGISPAGEWQGLREDRVNVLISFDDGFRNNLTHALPVLRHYGVSAIFFLISDCIEHGSTPGFLKSRLGLGQEMPHFATLSQPDVDHMIAADMTIGSHSLAHEDHSAMANDTMLEEAEMARSALEKRLGVEVANFAFPWGKHLPGQDHAMLDVYRRVFLTEHGFAKPADRIIPRNEVTTLAHLKAAASGALDALRGLFGKA